MTQSGNSILSVTMTIQKIDYAIINVSSPSEKEGNAFFGQYSPDPNSIMSGDFNCHHAMWDAEHSTSRADSIRNSNKTSTIFNHFVQKHGYSLTNTLVTFTIFPLMASDPALGILPSPAAT